jgi:hypothetical protein
MVFCTKCGNELLENSTYCMKCGAKVGDSPVPHKRSRWWYLLPILFSIIGGIIAYFVVKEDDPKLAKNCLILGLILLAVNFVIGMAIGAMTSIMWTNWDMMDTMNTTKIYN